MTSGIDDAVDKIKDIILKKKGKLFVSFLDDLDNKKIISPVDNEEEENRELTSQKVLTNTVIDDIIGGGIPEGKMALLYGEFATGKTQTCLSLVALCTNRVVFIDPEGSFSFVRLKEICEAREIDYELVKKKLILYKPKDWVEQMLIVHSIPAPQEIEADGLGKIDLIVCDSLSCFFRGIEFYGRNTLPLKTGLLREFMLGMKRIGKEHHAAIISTSQVSEKPQQTMYSTSSETQSPIGGHSVSHQPDFLLHYRKGSGNIRVVRMMDSSYNPLAERAFVLTKKGVEDLPPEAKKAKSYQTYSEKFDQKQQQEIDIPKKKKSETDKVLDANPETKEEE